MIRINLLPVRAERKKERGRAQLGVFVLVLILVAGANWLWFRSVDRELKAVRAEVSATQRKIAELEKIIGEVNDIKTRQEELRRKLEVIATLRKQKTGPVKLMDAMSDLIPKEVWISEFAEKNGSFTLKGQAISHDDLADFLRSLKSSRYFKDVVLKSAVLKREGETDLVQFTLTGQADYAA